MSAAPAASSAKSQFRGLLACIRDRDVNIELTRDFLVEAILDIICNSSGARYAGDSQTKIVVIQIDGGAPCGSSKRGFDVGRG
jgi:hypothetical protein